MLSGPLKGKKLNSSEISVVNHVHDIFNATSHKEIDGNLNKLWDLDSLGIREKDSVHELLLTIFALQENDTLLGCHGR